MFSMNLISYDSKYKNKTRRFADITNKTNHTLTHWNYSKTYYRRTFTFMLENVQIRKFFEMKLTTKAHFMFTAVGL